MKNPICIDDKIAEKLKKIRGKTIMGYDNDKKNDTKINKDYYIEKISSLSNRYGDKLIELMELYNCSNLRQVTEEQTKEFYNKIRKD